MMHSRRPHLLVAALLALQLVAGPMASRPLHAESVMGAAPQSSYNPLGGPPYPFFQDSYFTDDYGNILMSINVLGKVGRQGQFIVRESANFATVFALVGGIQEDANLHKVLVIRHEPDESGKQAYLVDLKAFYKKGDCSNFIALKPGDTIIVPDKSISMRKIAQVLSMAYPIVSLYRIFDGSY